ncbi:MAG TPA: proton-conducting transporter membrane subunit [Kofleriaceae bacterium]|nr:proton-conducting transporter membrane subunit [Kofleriaceae bacterium]
MLLALVLLPIAMGALAFAAPSPRLRTYLVVTGAALHAALAVFVACSPPPPMFDRWLVLEPLGRLIVPLLSVQFLLCALYVPAYLAARPERQRQNRVFCACLLALGGTMSLVAVSHHLGLMWVGIEASALVSAPLIYFYRTPRSLEATWKYLLIGSVGVAFALYGSFFLASSALHGGQVSSLLFEDLVRAAPHLSKPWLHAAFVILLIGYGTKIGLAPMHTWKPDVYGEAPAVVGAVLAGGLSTCALTALMRFLQICTAAGDGQLARSLLVVFGLLSMGVAAAFMIGQRDYKRMLAYSSVEHMGIIVFGLGIGGLATYGALLHILGNSFGKGVLFMTAGNLHRGYGSKLAADVSGAIHRFPASAGLFLAGFFAITGSPPFGLFLSELAIARGAFASGSYLGAALFLALLATVFIGMGAVVISVVQGPRGAEGPREREQRLTLVPPALCLAVVLLLGVYVPPWLDSALREAAAVVEMRP